MSTTDKTLERSLDVAMQAYEAAKRDPEAIHPVYALTLALSLAMADTMPPCVEERSRYLSVTTTFVAAIANAMYHLL